MSEYPTIQVVAVKRINNKDQDRFRLAITDGEWFQHAMLATQLNHLVESDSLLKHSICILKKYVCNSIQGRQIIIILELEVIQKNSDKLFGSSISPSFFFLIYK